MDNDLTQIENILHLHNLSFESIANTINTMNDTNEELIKSIQIMMGRIILLENKVTVLELSNGRNLSPSLN